MSRSITNKFKWPKPQLSDPSSNWSTVHTLLSWWTNESSQARSYTLLLTWWMNEWLKTSMQCPGALLEIPCAPRTSNSYSSSHHATWFTIMEKKISHTSHAFTPSLASMLFGYTSTKHGCAVFNRNTKIDIHEQYKINYRTWCWWLRFFSTARPVFDLQSPSSCWNHYPNRNPFID